MHQLKQEQQRLHRIINENEKEVHTLKVNIKKLREETGTLESQLEDRDIANEKMLKHKKLYEKSLRELLSAKKEQNELEQTVKQKILTTNLWDGKIKRLRQQKEHLNKHYNESRNKCQREMDALTRKHNSELNSARCALNAQRMQYEVMSTQQEALRESLLDQRDICEGVKQRIDVQKESFQQGLEQLVVNHSRDLTDISNDTRRIEEVVTLMKNFSRSSNKRGGGNDNRLKTGIESKGNNAMTMGIWEPTR